MNAQKRPKKDIQQTVFTLRHVKLPCVTKSRRPGTKTRGGFVGFVYPSLHSRGLPEVVGYLRCTVAFYRECLRTGKNILAMWHHRRGLHCVCCRGVWVETHRIFSIVIIFSYEVSYAQPSTTQNWGTSNEAEDKPLVFLVLAKSYVAEYCGIRRQ